MYSDTAVEYKYCIIKDDFKIFRNGNAYMKEIFTSKVATEPISISYIYYGLQAKCKNYLDI